MNHYKTNGSKKKTNIVLRGKLSGHHNTELNTWIQNWTKWATWTPLKQVWTLVLRKGRQILLH